MSEKAQEVEGKLPVLKHQQARWKSNPEDFVVNCFWGRRPDGVTIKIKKNKVFFLEFKWSTDREEEFLKVKEVAAKQTSNTAVSSKCSDRLSMDG